MLPHGRSRSGAPCTGRNLGWSRPGFETSEVRWFGAGRLPSAVLSWFSTVPGIVEHRRDSYRIGGSSDLGVKRRNGSGLEAKIRCGLAGALELSEGLSAAVEEWVKVTGLDEADLPGEGRIAWLGVDKVVWSRIYRLDGAGRVGPTTNRDLTIPGCDVELASIAIGDDEAWTFALEAWGPHDVRLSLLDSTAAVLREHGAPLSLRDGLGPAMGYPEWLSASAPALT